MKIPSYDCKEFINIHIDTFNMMMYTLNQTSV